MAQDVNPNNLNSKGYSQSIKSGKTNYISYMLKIMMILISLRTLEHFFPVTHIGCNNWAPSTMIL